MGGWAQSPDRSVSRRWLMAGGAAIALGAVAGCQTAGASQGEATAEKGNALLPEVKVPPKAQLAITPKHESTDIGLDEPIQVSASGGKLRNVVVQDDDGSEVSGEFDEKRQTWRSKDSQLMPDRGYVVQAEAANVDGKVTETKARFATAPPSEVVGTDITPLDGQTVGVGMPIVVEFDQPVSDRAAAQQQLVVEASREVEGAWHWFSDSEVHYRPKEYWPANTDVTVKLNFKDFQYGENAWGVKNKTRKFKVGRSVVTRVDLKNKFQANVYINGKVSRTIPVTGGKKNWETRNGTKLVLERRTDINFVNEAIGAEEDYDLISPYGLRVTWSGEFLHTAQWSLKNLGRRNASHGCVGMNKSNSKWLWKNSQVGDPVEFSTTGAGMPVTGNGYGDWNMSWEDWTAGSAA